MEIDVGHVVAEKYELVRLLGRGSMGEVWVAHHRTLQEHLALKLLTQSPSNDEEVEDATTAAARFLFEAQVAARLSRKTRHIVRVTDHGDDRGMAYLVMELLEGETLEAVLVRDRRLPPATVGVLVTQIARALAQAHGEGVLHRDLKPANVFLSRDEDGQLLVKLLDFGIARAIHAHRVRSAFSTAKGLVFGTPSYMSPEQARASPNLNHQCDLWALATIAYEALTGELPVDGADTDELLHKLCSGRVRRLRDVAPQLPAPLDAVFARAFSEAIGARYPSATELARAIDEAIPRGETSPIPPLSPPEPPEQAESEEPAWTMQAQRRRRRARAGLVAALLSLLVLLGVGFVWRTTVRSPAGASPAPSALAAVPPRSDLAPAAPSASSSPPRASSGLPAVAVSALPRSPVRAAAGPTHAAGPTFAPEPTTSAPAMPQAAPPPTPTPAPSPAPTPKKLDKSEVL